MREKIMSLSQATDLIKDGMLLAMGGNAMHRNPALFSLALTQKPVKVCGAAPGIAADILLATLQADTAYFGRLWKVMARLKQWKVLELPRFMLFVQEHMEFLSCQWLECGVVIW